MQSFTVAVISLILKRLERRVVQYLRSELGRA
jgi:hypothetical protein